MKMKLTLIVCLLGIHLSYGLFDKNVIASASECPSHWEKIGTRCYLFAIPEILRLDDSCRIDGKSKTSLATTSSMLRFNTSIKSFIASCNVS